MKRILGCVAVLAACVVTAANVQAQDEATQKRREEWRERQEFLQLRGILKLETMVMTGDPSKRVDIVVMPDGYQRETFKSFKADSDKVARQLVLFQPFDNFRNYINFHRMYIESPKGGFILGSEVSSARILTCDRAKAEDMAQYAPDCDLMLVVAKTRRRARSTASGNLITLYAGGRVTKTTIHELGHAFANLADEYVEFDVDLRDLGDLPVFEPGDVNVTLESVPLMSKWHYWVDPKARRQKVNNYEGALYVKRGVYRPESNCMMRHGGNFCVVCLEQMVRMFFKKIHPIDEQTPETVNVVMCNDEKKKFSVQALQYKVSRRSRRSVSAKMRWRWYLDNEPMKPARSKSAASVFELDGETTSPGLHEIVVSCDLKDLRVRRDLGRMSDARFWRVEVMPYPCPKLSAPERKVMRLGEEVAFEVKAEDLEGGKFVLKAIGLPKGATFDAATGAFAWTPREDQAGAHLIDFVAANDKLEERVQTFIAVGKGTGANKPPEMGEVFDENGFEGRAFNFTVSATDPDGDALVFNISNIPDGAQFDRRTGKLTWRPGYMDCQKRYAVAEATDGFKTCIAKIILSVENVDLQAEAIEGLYAGKKDMNFDFCIPLRSRDPSYRVEGLKRLANCPLPFRVAHIVRLLRDDEAMVKDDALSLLKREKEDEEFIACFFLEMAGKVIQFTDEREVLEVFGEIFDLNKNAEYSPLLKRCVGAVGKGVAMAERYNQYRDMLRVKVEAQREKEAEEAEED